MEGLARDLSVAIALSIVSGVGSAAAQGVQPASTVTEELRRLLAADQAEPEPSGVPADPPKIRAFYEGHWRKTFGPRYQRALELVRSGALSSAEDYFIAGTLINHGITPEDYLVAHVLFTVAALKGHREARWASAAALDGFLDESGRPQLFGTVYASIEEGWERRVTEAPMTDALRRELCVPTVESQRKLEEYLRRGDRAAFNREKVDCASPE